MLTMVVPCLVPCPVPYPVPYPGFHFFTLCSVLVFDRPALKRPVFYPFNGGYQRIGCFSLIRLIGLIPCPCAQPPHSASDD